MNCELDLDIGALEYLLFPHACIIVIITIKLIHIGYIHRNLGALQSTRRLLNSLKKYGVNTLTD